MNSSFFDSENKSSMWPKNTIKTNIIHLILITFSVFLIADCKCNNSGEAKKTDSATQPNSQKDEGENGRGMDTIHQGMGHGPHGQGMGHGPQGHGMDHSPHGMDTMHQRRHE